MLRKIAYLANLASRSAFRRHASVAPAPLTVLFGTQTGNSAVFARKLAREAKKRGLTATLADLYEYDFEKLPSEERVVFVTSSFGEGEPPDNAKKFFDWLIRHPHPRLFLNDVQFAVFGLGALRSYANRYQAAPKLLDATLANFGATRIHERGEGNSDGEMEEEFETWKTNLFAKLVPAAAATADNAAARAGTITTEVAGHFALQLKGSASASAAVSAPDGMIAARVTRNVELHTAQSPRSARHVEFDIAGSNHSYAAGDWLSVLPENSVAQVQRLLTRLPMAADAEFTMAPTDVSVDADTAKTYSVPTTLQNALMRYHDITSPATRAMLRVFAQSAASRTERTELEEMCSFSDQGKVLYESVVKKPGRSVIDMLHRYPSIQVPVALFLETLPRMQQRFYSIASSPLMFPRSVHLTVGVVRDTTPLGTYYGLCSNFLANTAPNGGATTTRVVPVQVRPSLFRLPEDRTVPVLMLCGGVGIAPFRAFLQQLQVMQSIGDRINPVYMYFGCRNHQHDYLYQSELEGWLQSGVVKQLNPVFSHERGPQLLFVQEKLVDDSRTVADVLTQGTVLVCGNAATFAAGVFDGLAKVLSKELQMSDAQAAEQLHEMQRNGRYKQDVF